MNDAALARALATAAGKLLLRLQTALSVQLTWLV